jgi:uncharacterized protein (TIGR02996 family)
MYMEKLRARSHEFFEIEHDGDEIVTREGEVGTDGVERRHAAGRRAVMVYQRLMEEKVDEGFIRVARPDDPRTPDLPGLLAAVIARPDDDEPRLVMADHLAEAGDPRGEFIQLQIAVALPGGGVTREMKARMWLLLERHNLTWLAPLRALGADHGVFRRGFIEEVSIDADVLMRKHKELFASFPVRRLRIFDADREDRADLAKLAARVPKVEYLRSSVFD